MVDIHYLSQIDHPAPAAAWVTQQNCTGSLSDDMRIVISIQIDPANRTTTLLYIRISDAVVV